MNYFVGDGINACEAEFVHHFQERSPASVVARGLRIKIADHFVGLTHVDPNDLHESLVGLATVEELHDRDAQPFFENLARLGGENSSADIGAVASVGKQCD